MVEEADRKPCRRPECEVATTSVCGEGHDPLESCPYYLKDAIDDFDDRSDDSADAEDTAATSGEIDEDWVALPQGEALSVADVDEFLRWRPAAFITIVGDRDSGKTTLVCAIYDRFLKGPFAGHLFTGSRTLVGLERRSHYAREVSGRAQPDTARTSMSEGLRFLHFAVAPADCSDTRFDLMLSDRAGEVYRQARSNSGLVADLVEVTKAQRLVLLLDGGRVGNPVERAGAMQSVRQTLRAFLDGGALGSSSVVQVVTTKIDLLTGHEEKTEIDTRLSAFRERLEIDFRPRLAEPSFWEIAARDPLGGFEPAFGVNALLTDWVRPRSPAVVRRSQVTSPLQSEFDRLLLRTPMEVVP